MAEKSGIPLNTLLARKRRAILHLRSRLQTTYDDWGAAAVLGWVVVMLWNAVVPVVFVGGRVND